MILCFSGTGNSRYVADRIALLTSDTVTDMNGLIRQGGMNEYVFIRKAVPGRRRHEKQRDSQTG